MYSPVHRREFRERMLEITLWDQARVREEESEFLGEVRESDPPPVTRDTFSAHPVKAPGLLVRLWSDMDVKFLCLYLPMVRTFFRRDIFFFLLF